MNKEERVRLFTDELEIFSSYKTENGVRCLSYDKTAKALDILGYHKIVWHKIADGDLPADNQEIRWVDNTNNYYNGFYDSNDQQFRADVGCYFNEDEVVAWTELPTYEE